MLPEGVWMLAVAVVGATLNSAMFFYMGYRAKERVMSNTEQAPMVRDHEYVNHRVQRPGKNTESLTTFTGHGYAIKFQDGRPKDHGVNGTTNEEIVESVLLPRLRSQNKLEPCPETEAAIDSLENVMRQLNARTARYGARH